MLYARAREDIRSGDLLAWTHRSWASWYDVQVQMVRVFTRSEFCHVGVAWSVAGRVLVLEAVGSGVRIFPLSRLLPVYHVPLGAPWLPEVEAWALAQVGKPYSKWQAVLGHLGLLDVGQDDKWQCAEYAREIAVRLGVPMPGKPTPSGVVREAMGRGAPCHLLTR